MSDFDDLEAQFAKAVEDEDPEKGATRTRKPRADKGMPRGRRAFTKNLANELLVPWAKMAQTLAFGAPTISAVLLSRGEKTVDALVSIAGDHPRMMAALKQASKIGPASELAETVAHIGIAAALDFGRIPPTHPVAILTGVADLYNEVHQTEQPLPEPGSESPNGFAPVTMPPYMRTS